MKTDQINIATVSRAFIQDWLDALSQICPDHQMIDFLEQADLDPEEGKFGRRVTLDQIVRLYQIVAVETGDEMMGLWSRPIRASALKHLLTSVREASSLPAALYRFATFWNLLLDDYHFGLVSEGTQLVLKLNPLDDRPVPRFSHMLILKLSHGLMSWMAGYELPLVCVDFAFDQPDFAEDYPVLFPAPVHFGRDISSITYDRQAFGSPASRSKSDLIEFVRRAPRDWIFTSSHEHALSLRIREILHQSEWRDCRLVDVAARLNLTPRTLMRRLEADQTSFQAIKDGLRRDMAIRSLQSGQKTVEEISHDVGFSSSANFYRAFRLWTGVTPGAYR